MSVKCDEPNEANKANDSIAFSKASDSSDSSKESLIATFNNGNNVLTRRTLSGGQTLVVRSMLVPTVQTNGAHFHHNYHELAVEEEERLERLFRQLDVNSDGVIDVNDLVQSFELKGIKASPENIKVCDSG